jgi:hypothetical protein
MGNDPIYLQLVQDLQRKIEENINILKKYPKEKITWILDRHQGHLFRIFDVTIGSFGKTNLRNEEITIFRSIMDKFSKLLFKTHSDKNKYFKNIPTKLFTEFCKGVTYLIYHRNISGGDKNERSDVKFKIKPSNSDDTQNKKKNFLKRCLIERLVYDNRT